MTTKKFDYTKFNTLLEIKNLQKKEAELIKYIDSDLCHFFEIDNKFWFNTLCRHGLTNVIYHCERTIPYFKLYNEKEKPDHLSNVGFLWGIESGNLELIEYFTQHEDFPQFCKIAKLEQSITLSAQNYKDRNKTFSLKNYENIIDFLIGKFPWSIPHFLEKNIINQKNDETTPFLTSFVNKYEPYIKDYLKNDASDNNLTRLFMVSLDNNSLAFGEFLKEKFPDISIKDEFLSYYLLTWPNISVLQWFLDNPQCYQLTEAHFNKMYERVFNTILPEKATKNEYNFFFTVTKAKLHTVTQEEFQTSIVRNMTPFVKKYYRHFQNSELDLYLENLVIENTCTKFIARAKKEQQYKDLLKKLPAKNIQSKKIKI